MTNWQSFLRGQANRNPNARISLSPVRRVAPDIETGGDGHGGENRLRDRHLYRAEKREAAIVGLPTGEFGNPAQRRDQADQNQRNRLNAPEQSRLRGE